MTHFQPPRHFNHHPSAPIVGSDVTKPTATTLSLRLHADVELEAAEHEGGSLAKNLRLVIADNYLHVITIQGERGELNTQRTTDPPRLPHEPITETQVKTDMCYRTAADVASDWSKRASFPNIIGKHLMGDSWSSDRGKCILNHSILDTERHGALSNGKPKFRCLRWVTSSLEQLTDSFHWICS
jgi:hypothetical protein